MLRHIVMWKFRPGTEAERDLFLTGLQGLYGAIPELKSCQVLRGMEGSDYDAVLISEFADRAALESLQERSPAQGGLRSVQIHPDGPGGGGLSAAGSGGISKKRRRFPSRPLNRRRNTS